MAKPLMRMRAAAEAGSVHLSWYQSTPAFEAGDALEFSSFRILRREEPAFVFGRDYDEYFLGEGAGSVRAGANEAARAETVFEGALEPHNGRKYDYIDRTAQVGRTYSYFVQTRTSAPIGPLPVRVRDEEVWWPHQTILARVAALRNRWPQAVSAGVCGRTAMGRDIPCLLVGRGPCALGLVGLVHAGESGPELILPTLDRLLEERGGLLERCSIVAVPGVNLDGREDLVRGVPWYLRTNAQGVDLNRNFPASWEQVEYGYGMDSSQEGSASYRGPRPASAPETQAVMAFLGEHKPRAVLSHHWLASLCGLPAIGPAAAKDDAAYVQRCRGLIDVFGREFLQSEETDRKGDATPFPAAGNGVASPPSWLAFGCTAGSLPTWLYQTTGALAMDMEGGMGPSDAAAAKDQTDRAMLADYQSRHARAVAAVLEALAENPG